MHDIPLQHLCLRPSTLELLQQRGFASVAEIENSKTSGGMANFAAELGVGIQEARRLYKEVIATSSSSSSSMKPTVTAIELLQQQQSNRSIITFCRNMDVMLGGGLPVGLCELAGSPGTGKTAIAMQLSVNAALPTTAGGVHGRTVYIDTEGSFSPERCREMASALIEHIQKGFKRRQHSLTWNVTADEILNGIDVFRVHDVTDLIAVLSGPLEDAIHQHANSEKPVRLVVIDSIAFPFRAVSHDFVTRTRQLTSIASNLTELATTHQIAVLAVNQMTTKENGTLLPALGESWAHAVTTRLVLSKSMKNNSTTTMSVGTCTLTKSPQLPPASAEYQITQSGIRGLDYKTKSGTNSDPSKRQRTNSN